MPPTNIHAAKRRARLTTASTVASDDAPRTLGGRVAYLMARERMKISALDEAVGRPRSGFTSRLISGDKLHPHPDILLKISRMFSVRLEWLLSGEAPMRDVVRSGDVYPCRANVAAAARLLDWMFPEEAVAALERVTLPSTTTDPGGAFWWVELHRLRDETAAATRTNARAARILRDGIELEHGLRPWPIPTGSTHATSTSKNSEPE